MGLIVLSPEKDNHIHTHQHRQSKNSGTGEKALYTSPVHPFSPPVIPDLGTVPHQNHQGNQGAAPKQNQTQQIVSHFRPGSCHSGQKICQHQIVKHVHQD